jgi:hypothetical protein
MTKKFSNEEILLKAECSICKKSVQSTSIFNCTYNHFICELCLSFHFSSSLSSFTECPLCLKNSNNNQKNLNYSASSSSSSSASSSLSSPVSTKKGKVLIDDYSYCNTCDATAVPMYACAGERGHTICCSCKEFISQCPECGFGYDEIGNNDKHEGNRNSSYYNVGSAATTIANSNTSFELSHPSVISCFICSELIPNNNNINNNNNNNDYGKGKDFFAHLQHKHGVYSYPSFKHKIVIENDIFNCRMATGDSGCKAEQSYGTQKSKASLDLLYTDDEILLISTKIIEEAFFCILLCPLQLNDAGGARKSSGLCPDNPREARTSWQSHYPSKARSSLWQNHHETSSGKCPDDGECELTCSIKIRGIFK